MIEHQKDLIKKNLEVIRNKKWYNQRFDGCINLIWMISEGEMRPEKRKMKGGNFSSHFGIFKNNTVDWYIDREDIERVTSLFLKKAKNGKNIGKKIISQWRGDEKGFLNYCRKIDKLHLEVITIRELGDLYSKFTEVYRRAISSSSLIDGFALGTDEIVQKKINDFLDKRGIDKGRGIIFSKLTAPVHQSFINEAELSLIRLAIEIKKDKKLKKFFTSEIAKIKNKLALSPIFKKHLEIHAKNYFWSKNNYYDNNILDINYFIKELKSLISSSVNLERELFRIKKTPFLNKLEKKKIISQLKPDNFLLNLLEISEDFTHWQDERKKMTFHFTHYASILLEIIGQRTKHSLDGMKYLTSREVMDLLQGKNTFRAKDLEERKKLSLIYQKNNFYEIYSGLEAEKAIKQIFTNDKKQGEINDFRGLSAASGKARGRVKIIKSVKEVGKVEKGDILVAVMTRPDYIVGIKNAGALVTDEGGITCHAAIVARELGIPCIIGTKIATKVLKDGDLVEVNANHGWVRKIKD
ncbi:MAG: PEP-utilizing enzyme [Patescibacteria group bacterium]